MGEPSEPPNRFCYPRSLGAAALLDHRAIARRTARSRRVAAGLASPCRQDLAPSRHRRLLAARLARLPDITVGAVDHPQSNIGDFYRELGDIFGVPLRPSNRWGGFKALRERWFAHLESARARPVLLIDEAQEMSPQVLSELRLLASARFDSQPLLCIVMAGDTRLIEKLRREELVPLGSRIRTRLATEFASREELLACLEHLLAGAGNASLMTEGLRHTLCDHALGNYRVLTTMAAELLAGAAQRDLALLDEKLYMDVFAPPAAPPTRRTAAAR